MATGMHDPGMSDSLKRRVQSLTRDSTRAWGKMTIDQMLHHVNLVLAESVGEHKAERSIRGLPEFLIRFAIIYLPWPRGAPTRPDMLIPDSTRFDFATEKQRCLDLIDKVLARPYDGPWPRAANFAMTGKHWSHLNYKHLDHHLRQFSA